MSEGQDARRAVEGVARDSHGRLLAYLAAGSREIAAAEDALADALESALRTWPARGVPDRPEAWVLTTARRALVDGHRRRAVAAAALPALAQMADERTDLPDAEIPDRRLELMFACAHPAIDPGVRCPLILQTVLGLDAARIASAFLLSPAALGQRLVRAKARIAAAGIPFAVPGRDDLPGRLDAVLDAVYAAYGTGWDDLSGADGRRADLTAEAVFLARLVAELLPAEAEAHGLAALVLHLEARAGARLDDRGRFVPLTRQDPSRWSRDLVSEAESHLRAALPLRSLGPYQVMAAIQSAHNHRAATGRTDWGGIASLYDGLVAIAPGTGARVARAAAHGEAFGPARGLGLLEALPEDEVRGYQPYWAVRAELSDRAGDRAGSADAARRAFGLATDPAVRAHLVGRYPVLATG